MDNRSERIHKSFNELKPKHPLPDNFDWQGLNDLILQIKGEITPEIELHMFEDDAKKEQAIDIRKIKKLISKFQTPKAKKQRSELITELNNIHLSISSNEKEIIFLEELMGVLGGLGSGLDRLANMIESAKKIGGRPSVRTEILESICQKLGQYYVDQTEKEFTCGTWYGGKPPRTASGACFVYAAISVLYPERKDGVREILRETGFTKMVNDFG